MASPPPEESAIVSNNGVNHKPRKSKLNNPFITDHEIRSEFAHHDRITTRINNGSFGSCLPPSSKSSASGSWSF
ncbi:unnamed protein product [Rhodiola kirilowii]